jgi:Ca2+/H+ antiporter
LAILDYFGRKTRFLLGAAIVATVASAFLVVSGGAPVATFGATAIALAMLASLVGEGTEQLGARQGPAVTGILQSALGNLPELFIWWWWSSSRSSGRSSPTASWSWGRRSSWVA